MTKLALSWIAFLLVSGCSLITLQENLDVLEELAYFSGEVQSEQSENQLVVALVQLDQSTPVVVNYQILPEPGYFEFRTQPGRYRIFAYADWNQNLRHDIEEPAVRSQLFIAEEKSRATNIALDIPAEPAPELQMVIQNLKSTGKYNLPAHKKHLGQIITLDDPVFKEQNASMGMWEPLRFVNEVPFGIFFLEPYDSNKIPVLFVHGIGGSPQSFRQIIAKLDRSRFQPWVAFYPSAFQLDLVVRLFDNALSELKVRYQFDEIGIVAHSMGGLVSRGLVLEDAKRRGRSFITRLITLSTPWGGHDAARIGAESAPVVMPVWKDMTPGSPFLTDLFKKELPTSTPHYLLFGFKGSAGLFRENNDGAVSLKSQLRSEAQKDAALIRGIDANHVDILETEEAITLVQQGLLHR